MASAEDAGTDREIIQTLDPRTQRLQKRRRSCSRASSERKEAEEAAKEGWKGGMGMKTATWDTKPICSMKGCEENAPYHFNTGFAIVFSCEKHIEEQRKILQKIHGKMVIK